MEETITLAGGCFWCTEAIFRRINGVTHVTSGYANSLVENPNYEAVCSGETGAAEALQIKFDSKIVSLEKLLEIFFATIDPTTLNRQGNDVGTQYRSGIYFSNASQEETIKKLLPDSAVTEVKKLENFCPAEELHQSFYEKNRKYPYCRLIIDPKIHKLVEEFGNEVKTNG